MARTLKVFSTSAGFYEAVVAAPSRKAALAAWGVHDDLFASGAAREVDDPGLRDAALARPGEIVRVPIRLDPGLVAAPHPRGPLSSFFRRRCVRTSPFGHLYASGPSNLLADRSIHPCSHRPHRVAAVR